MNTHCIPVLRTAKATVASILLCAGTFLCTATAPSTASAQSLMKLGQRVADDHPRIRLLRAQVRAAQFEVQQIVGANGLRVSTFAEPSRTFSGSDDGPTASSSDFGVRARYPIYDWGKANGEVGQAEARLGAAQARVDAEIITQWLKLSDTYIEVLRNNSAMAANESYVEALLALRNQMQEIVNVDKGRAIDLRQVESRLQQGQLQLLQRKTAGVEALIQLRTLTNLPSAVTVPIDTLSNTFPSSIETMLTRLDQHPALLEAARQINEAEQGVSVAKAQERPQFDIQATLSSRNAFGHFKAFSQREVRIMSQWDFYDGGSAKSKSAGASERLLAVGEQAQAVRRDLDSEVRRTWSRQHELRTRAPLWIQQIVFTQQLRSAYWEQFRVGRRTVLDLLSVENDIFQARLNETADQYDLFQSEYRLFIQLGMARERWSK
jgi:adhesin transport system outer membrane protein